MHVIPLLGKQRLAWLAILIIAALNIAIWSWVNVPTGDGAYVGKVNGFSFAPYQKDQNPEKGQAPTTEQLKSDLKTVGTVAHSVRTYTVLSSLGQIPALATADKLDVTLGAWVDRAANNTDRTEREIAALVRLARENPGVTRVIVGNESLLRTDVTMPQLIDYISRVKAQINVPVSTAEPWHVWLANPELVDAVDYITVHVLPYWEGIPIDAAVNYVFMRLHELHEKYPNKHILLGETGWPSEGQWQKGAEPSRLNQERFMRDFLTRAKDEGVDYFIVEAFDQPWKRSIEGSVGAYWGFFDQNRHPKLELAGVVSERRGWEPAALIATLLGLFPIIYFARRQRRLGFGGILFYGALIQLVASLLVWTVLGALVAGDAAKMGWVWGAALLAQFMLLAVLLADGFEFTEMVFNNKLQRLFGPAPDDGRKEWPKVSIHVPCYNEPPEMVIDTLNHLAALDYPNFEVLLIDNNTKDPNVWLPVQAHCAQLNQAGGFTDTERFRFIHLDNWPGYKAGALNYGLKVTAADAEVIAVIDSDYNVIPSWLKATIPYFDNPKMAIVQAPQDYRDWQENTFQAMCNWEYAGFFYIGMIHRNERNAIIQHGTMTQVRKKYLEDGGAGTQGWAEWCITEDAELGLRMFQEGYEAAYLPHSFGQGLIPDGFSAYKTQRFRWAYGAIQILKRHWRTLLPWKDEAKATQLNDAQRFHFIAGWLPWVADSALLLFTTASLIWSLLLCLHFVEFPPAVFLIPTLCAFIFKVTSGMVLYGLRVKANWGQRIGAAIAGMALTHTVGRAVLQGFMTRGKPFVRTPKLADRPALLQGILMAGEEIVLLVGLIIAATAVLIFYTPQNHEALLWSSMLYIQTLPYWAAFITAMINAVPALSKLPFFIGPGEKQDNG